jgi:hypothetical protein
MTKPLTPRSAHTPEALSGAHFSDRSCVLVVCGTLLDQAAVSVRHVSALDGTAVHHSINDTELNLVVTHNGNFDNMMVDS